MRAYSSTPSDETMSAAMESSPLDWILVPAAWPTRRWRRRLSALLLAAALLIVGASLAAAQHLVGHPQLRHPVAGVLAALTLTGLAFHLTLTGRGWRTLAFIGMALAIAVTAFVGVMGRSLDGALDGNEGTGVVVARSAHFTLTEETMPALLDPGSGKVVLTLQGRDGLRSPDGSGDLACFPEPNSNIGSEWLFDSARIDDAGTVAITTKDYRVWSATFDPKTLATLVPVDRCTNAPDPDFD